MSDISFSTRLFEQIVALHRANARTLGFFPMGAFEEHAKLKQIIAALDESGDCCGYLLYRVARGRANIVHLCVSEAARGRGAAKTLVEELKRRTKSLEGIGLYCRRDYDAAHVWSKLGFEALNAKAGRGKDGAELTFWWFSHGHEDLFSRATEPAPFRQRVVIDTNVFYDLHCRTTPESEDSKALLADWVQTSIELVVTKELRNEIANGPDEGQRRKNRSNATKYNTLPAADTEFQRLCVNLRACFPEATTLRDDADLRQVAYAIAGAAAFLVTRDEILIDRCEPLYRSYGLTVLHPAELIKHLDAIEREGDYRPARIEGSRLTNTPLTAAGLNEAIAAFKQPDERDGDFKKALLHCFSQPKCVDIQIIKDEFNAATLLGVMDRREGSVLSVPVLREGKHPLAATMLRNFLRACLTSAADENRSVVTISDNRLSRSARNVVREFGFVESAETAVKIALRAVGSIRELSLSVACLKLDQKAEAAQKAALDSIRIATDVREPAAFAAVERQLWPAKVTEPCLPTFIVPILPQWAQHFFDSHLGSQLLFGLRQDLHLGVEGVYYRSVENNNLTVPGRILWYVSKGSGSGPMAIKACSQLEEVVIGKPKTLFRRFQRLGVFEWRDIYTVANHDIDSDIAAFRFRMTERFKTPVTMEFLHSIGVRGPFMSPRKISATQFGAIYAEGFTLN